VHSVNGKTEHSCSSVRPAYSTV